jgi:hypothetical protein
MYDTSPHNRRQYYLSQTIVSKSDVMWIPRAAYHNDYTSHGTALVSLCVLKPLNTGGNYTYHLLYQSTTPHFVFMDFK